MVARFLRMVARQFWEWWQGREADIFKKNLLIGVTAAMLTFIFVPYDYARRESRVIFFFSRCIHY
jgi:hypothetical protein